MIKRILPAFAFLFPLIALHAQEKAITQGMKISQSVKIKKRIYELDAPADTSRGVIMIEGSNLIVDFNSAELKGSKNKVSPDEFSGVAIMVLNSRSLTIKNLKARNYKVALLVRNTENLVLDNCDLSYNFRQHLNSTQEKEDVSDWMSYHHNEKDEWLRYGAAIYMRNCHSAIIRNCRVTGGQNALMMTDCNDGKIYNNDFSFNSGIGIGMYRCNGNQIAYNKIDFNVRGYSHGIYSRGQDSAGILVYEQSNRNLFYKNSATHSGDGFFLWAGQTTMDSGKGGCNDNDIRENDFSYAPTNGVEVTFSRNNIAGNRIYECDHGIWGGYSYETNISTNRFRNNNVDIAIEHGQENKITYNIFYGSREAIRLWSRSEQPADWGYARNRDTRSRGYVIANNNFNSTDLVFNLTRSDQLSIFNNIYGNNKRLFKKDSTVTGLELEASGDVEVNSRADSGLMLPAVSKPADPFSGSGKYAGRKNILVTEWGPYDFRSPIIWNTNPTDTGGTMKFDLLGPKGKWKIKSFKGVGNFSAMSGEFPASLTAQKLDRGRTDILIELQYTGGPVITAFGEKIRQGRSYNFQFRKFFQPINWEVNWFHLDTTAFNPLRTGSLFPPNVKLRPFKTEKPNKLDYAWWGGIRGPDNEQHVQFITSASGQADFPKGEYEMSVTWDDAVRIYLDGKLVVDEWNPSLYNFDESPNKKIRLSLEGQHYFNVEHLELGGFATLALRFRKL